MEPRVQEKMGQVTDNINIHSYNKNETHLTYCIYTDWIIDKTLYLH